MSKSEGLVWVKNQVCHLCEGLDWVMIQVCQRCEDLNRVKVQVNGSARSCEGLDRVSI